MNGAVSFVGEKLLDPGPLVAWEGEDVAVELEIEPFDTAIRHVGAGLSKETAPQDPPKADAKREVKVDHGVASFEPKMESAPIVAINDPGGLTENRFLSCPELLGSGFFPVGTPEEPVEVVQRESKALRNFQREGGLAGAAASDDNDALHAATSC
jgi:hypothetical protein